MLFDRKTSLGHGAFCKKYSREKKMPAEWAAAKENKEKKTKPHSRMHGFVFPWDRPADMA